MINQLHQAASITIIGGADGPTSIYILSSDLWRQIAAVAVCFFALTGFGIYRLVKSIRNHDKAKTLLWSIVLFILLSLPFFALVFEILETRNNLKKFASELSAIMKVEDVYCYPVAADDAYFYLT